MNISLERFLIGKDGKNMITIKDYKEKSFEELIEQLKEERDDFHSYEDMKDFAKYQIDNDNLYFALHILNGIEDNPAEWYWYDYTMGTIDPVYSVTCKEDVEHLIEE